tara:strand:+ start:237 stop:416 length:180 start_codon:yes stop_codon:yes gene_type:complete
MIKDIFILLDQAENMQQGELTKIAKGKYSLDKYITLKTKRSVKFVGFKRNKSATVKVKG